MIPQVPGATVWYGPDTYMGANLAQLLERLADMPDEEVCVMGCVMMGRVMGRG